MEPNVQELSDQIGQEIFGVAGTPEVESTAITPQPETPVVETPSAAAPPPSPVEDLALPKAWKREMEPVWATLSPEARKYIQSRETDIVKGLDQYSGSHKNWSKLIEPYQSLLQESPQVDPVQLMQNLMNNHLAIVRATPEQRWGLAQKLLQAYGIQIPQAGGENSAPISPVLPPEVQQALGRVSGMERNLQTLQQSMQQQAIAEQSKVIAAFAADPKHKYFEEVGDDILRLLKTSAADSLESAYEMAIWANPVVRQKLLDEQIKAAKAPAKASTNIVSSGEGTLSKKKDKTIDDTIQSIVAKYTNGAL
jgi:hypothetical protein